MSLQKSFTVDAEIKVVLNNADLESILVLKERFPDVEFVVLNQNVGALGVDLFLPLLNSKYVANVNDDMLFYKGWDSYLIKMIESNYPCSATSSRVERQEGYDTKDVVVDDLGDMSEEATYDRFVENMRRGKYRLDWSFTTYHPIVVRYEDYVRVGGYSDGFDLKWVPGYALDDYFAYRLWKLHNEKFRFIASDIPFVYHNGGATTKRLKKEYKYGEDDKYVNPYFQWSYFQDKTGMSIGEFRNIVRNQLDVSGIKLV